MIHPTFAPDLCDLALDLRNLVRRAAYMGSGQTPLIQAILRQGLVGPYLDRVSEETVALGQLLEPLVEDHAADLLAWLLHQEGDRRVVQGPPEGVELLFQPAHAGHGWIRFFRVEAPQGHAYERKVEARLDHLVASLAQGPSEDLYGLVGLPIGPAFSEIAIREHLERTRWASGHWMAAAYVPSRGGFAVLGTAYDVLERPSVGDPVVPPGTCLMTALLEEPDLDLLPALGHPSVLGACWGGEAFSQGISKGLAHGCRLDVQWTPLTPEHTGLSPEALAPFMGAELSDWAEAPLLGILLPGGHQHILVCFEGGSPRDGIELGVLDAPARVKVQREFGALPDPQRPGGLRLPASGLGRLLRAGLPIWNRLLRLADPALSFSS